MKRISVDIGGTFTDCFLVWDNRHIEAKALTTHHNLSEGFLAALGNAATQIDLTADEVLSQVESVRYATTLGTNALLERRGRRLGVITTAGFEDNLALGRGVQYGDGLSDLAQIDLPRASRPAPLVEGHLTVGIQGRVDFRGNVVVPADPADIREKVQQLADRGARGFVIVLVNSVVNPEHELLVAELIEEAYPTSVLGAFPIVCSHQVSGRKGEYRRGMSAIIDAYLHSEMQYALQSLERALHARGYRRPMQIVHNSGGMAQLNRTHALQTVHAGPVAGLSAAEQAAGELDVDNLACVDMGGTSFDVGLVTDGGGVRHYEFEPIIDRWRVDVPMVDMDVIGAGGGSIARYDAAFGTVEVGPESAGSEPGPACFGMGGREPTVTDANLILGYLNPDTYFGGRLQLDVRRAGRVVRDRIARGLECSIEEAAAAIRHVVDDKMAQAIFNKMALKGYDPREFVVFAYGGNGPTHACGFTEGLAARRIIVPRNSPVFSAVGAGNMDQLHIHARSVHLAFYDPQRQSLFDAFEEINGPLDEMRRQGEEEIARQDLDPSAVRHRVELDMRYGDQLQLMTMECPFARFESVEQVLMIAKRFHDAYGARFGAGTQLPEAGINVNLLRVVSWFAHDKISLGVESSNGSGRSAAPQPRAVRPCWFQAANGFTDTPVYAYADARPGTVLEGPAIVEAPHTTFVVAPDWVLHAGSSHFELKHQEAW